MRVTKAVGWASVVAALFVAANDAHASCTSPLPGLLWSNPTLDGGHVPRDGVLWLLSTTGGFDSIEIDGSEITAPEAAWLPISLEGLEPGEHTISLMQLNHFVGEPLHLDGVFTIDAGRGLESGSVTEGPVVELVRTPFTEDECQDVFRAWECYDTGQDTFAILPVGTSREPIAWWVTVINPRGRSTTILLPANCGVPRIFGSYPDGAARFCFSVTPLYPEGPGPPSDVVCGSSPEPGADAGSGDVHDGDADWGDVHDGDAGGGDVHEEDAGVADVNDEDAEGGDVREEDASAGDVDGASSTNDGEPGTDSDDGDAIPSDDGTDPDDADGWDSDTSATSGGRRAGETGKRNRACAVSGSLDNGSGLAFALAALGCAAGLRRRRTWR